eukprot:SAG31_NODE_10911_length_1085_cov_1.040568_2_plen_182_part_00
MADMAGQIAFRPVVDTIAEDGVSGMTTYQLKANLANNQANIYAIYGDSDSDMEIPAAYQTPAPLGANVGGINPAFYAFSPDCEYDSWLTVGPTDGSAGGGLSAIGIDFNSWTAEDSLVVNDGAVFWMDPTNGPTGIPVIAQLTIPTGSTATAKINAQGKSNGDLDDWRNTDVEFTVGGDGN